MVMPSPLPDTARVEARLLLVLDMLERATEETRQALADAKASIAEDKPTGVNDEC